MPSFQPFNSAVMSTVSNYRMTLIWLEPGLGLLEELSFCFQPRLVRQIDALSVLDFRYKKAVGKEFFPHQPIFLYHF